MARTPHVARRLNADPPPVISLGPGPVAAPVVRTGVQGAVVAGAMRLVTVIPDPDLRIDQGDQAIIQLIGLAVVSLAWNLIEKWAGRQLLGRAPAPAIAPPEHV